MGRLGSDEAYELVIAIRRLAASQRALAQHRLSHLDLAPRHGAALRVIGTYGPCTHSLVSELCDLEPSNTTSVVARLESHGLVARSPSPSDSRVKLLTVTPQATPVLDEVDKIWAEIATTLTQGLSPSQRRTVLDFAESANTRMHDHLHADGP